MTVRIADNGPGFLVPERESLISGWESSLRHANRLGLWFVHWMVTNSNGTMGIGDNGPSGMIIELRLPKA